MYAMPIVKKTATTRRHAVKKQEKHLYRPYTPLNFSKIEKQAHMLADSIENRFEELVHILLEYESYEVVLDETKRTLDLLRNLKENKQYFRLRVGPVVTFLPRNQPLYALACFVIVPSFMASEVHFRIPQSMKHFYPKLLALLEINKYFPNIEVSHNQRTEFLREHTALRVNLKTKETFPVTDVVIFTGTPTHADQLRIIFDQRTLFITNGAGHNPVVVSDDANLQEAIEAVLTLQLYNQGQDCAAPNAILVHTRVFNDFRRMLRDEIRAVRVGDYRDRKCRVGPISDPKDLVRLQDFLIDNRKWLDPTTPGIIRAYDAILEPTVINKPLKEGGNFTEIFAPIMFLQEYEKDSDLALYFEDQRYAQNAMYVTLYGTSDYVRNLLERSVGGKMLHKRNSFLHNNHLHIFGSERGTQSYGGSGYGSSSLSINGKIVAKATLPQRDIYELVSKPLIRRDKIKNKKHGLKGATEIIHKDVQKLLRLKPQNEERVMVAVSTTSYLDLEGLKAHKNRYVTLNEDRIYRLLDKPNISHIHNLDLDDLIHLRALKKLLKKSANISLDDFTTALYAIVVRSGMTKSEIRSRQRRLFEHVYTLLLGRSSGPRLAEFLLEIDRKKAWELLDV